MKLIVYPDPLDSTCILDLDQNIHLIAVRDDDANGRPCQKFSIPSTAHDGWGAWLTISHSAKITLRQKGILYTDLSLISPLACFLADDFPLVDEKVCPECPELPPPNPDPLSPLEIIKGIYESGDYNLATKEGCGEFTEECCEQLHILNSNQWGHIKKIPPQNNYNGHATDAVMLLKTAGETIAGIYDLITDSESDNAKPSFNYKGEAEPRLWYYPA